MDHWIPRIDIVVRLGLRAHGGKVLKPFQGAERGERENGFYELVFKSREAVGNPLYAHLRSFLPTYHGCFVEDDDDNDDESSKQESETRGESTF